jgi:L-ectoine synthase
MIVRTLEEILGTERDVRTARWASRRLLPKADGMGFSMHDTLVRAGSETEIWYKHHLEACDPRPQSGPYRPRGPRR